MRVAVVHQSRTGHTSSAARWIAGAAHQVGADVSVSPVARPDLDAVAAADLIFVGTWVDGMILFGQRPGDTGRIVRNLPLLHDRPVAAFLTHAVNPGRAADKFATLIEDRTGARVVASRSFHRQRLDTEVADYVDGALAAVSV